MDSEKYARMQPLVVNCILVVLLGLLLLAAVNDTLGAGLNALGLLMMGAFALPFANICYCVAGLLNRRYNQAYICGFLAIIWMLLAWASFQYFVTSFHKIGG